MITEEKIKELKQKYGTVYTITIPIEDESSLTYVLRKPDKQTRKMIGELAKGEIPERAVIAGFNALKVDGDDVALLEKNDDAILSKTL
jgi:hypothetical protein